MKEVKMNRIQEFYNTINLFSKGISIWHIFKDFLLFAALYLANTVKTSEWNTREEQYLSLLHTYQEEEQKLFPRLLASLSLGLEENPEQDFLEEIYIILSLFQDRQGLIFMPYDMVRMIAEATYEDRSGKIASGGYILAHDSACGSGAKLIAFANAERSHGVNTQKEVLFVGQDLDRTSALMCYLQLSLLKLPGYVIIGDARLKLGRHPDNEVWYTPAFYMNALCFVDKSAEEARGCGQAADGSKLTLKPPADCVEIDRKLSFRL